MEKSEEKEGDPVYFTTRVAFRSQLKSGFERVLLGWEVTNQVILFYTLSAPDRNYKKEDEMLVVQISQVFAPPR